MREIDDDIKKETFTNCYLLYGEEEYLKKQYKQKLIQALIKPGDTMNFASFIGKNIEVKTIIDLAETLPFFAKYRVILMENTESFKQSSDELAEYIKEMKTDSNTIFLFIEEAIDKRNKLYKAVQKQGRCIEFKRQEEKVLVQWILNRLKKENRKITGSVMQLFLSKTGDDMELIEKELEKLLCYTMGKEVIEASDVEEICTEQTTNKIFEMVEAISAKQQKKALDLYYDLLQLHEPPMRILYLIVRQFHILFLAKSSSQANILQKDIAAICKIPPFAVKKHQAQARSFSLEELKQAVKDGVQAEEDVKTGKINDQLAVEMLLVKCSMPKKKS